MKKMVFAVAVLFAMTTHAGGSDVQSGGIEYQNLKCYKALNPQDARVILQKDEGGQTVKEEPVLTLNLDIRKFIPSDSKFHYIKAETNSMIYNTGAGTMRTETGRRAGVDCDGGGWNFMYLSNGGMRISSVDAQGEIKDRASNEGCIGTGRLKADKPIELAPVDCPQ